MLSPEFSSYTDEFLRTLEVKRQQQIVNKVLQLCDDPRSGATKRLSNSIYSSTRCGDYRIVHLVRGETLVIALVYLRGDVYKLLERYKL